MDYSKLFIYNNEKEIFKKILELFKKVKKYDELEFTFFRNNKGNMSFETYMKMMKYLLSFTKKNYSIENTKTLDIIYKIDKNNVLRCSVNGLEEINNIKNNYNSYNNDVILKTLIKIWSNDKKKLSFIKKTKLEENLIKIPNLNINLRLSSEKIIEKGDEILNINFDKNKINFRFKERTSLKLLVDNNCYINLDLTCVNMFKSFKDYDSNKNNYEIEVEYGSDGINNENNLLTMLVEVERILKVYEGSNYLILEENKKKIIESFKILTNSINNEIFTPLNPVSLEIQDIEILPNKYSVTDKMDGLRKLLYIYNNSVLFIDKLFNIIDTGIVLDKNDKNIITYNNSILDGELIYIKEKNNYLFCVFDCLVFKSEDIRKERNLIKRLYKADEIINNCFILKGQKGFDLRKLDENKDFNLQNLLKFHETNIIKHFNIIKEDMKYERNYPLIRRKYFLFSTGINDWEIFSYASLLWNMYTVKNNITLPYLLDGLIFQPLEQEYSSKDVIYKTYKWKPPEMNTIDFYIEYEKDNNGKILEIYDNSIGELSKNKTYVICNLFVGQKSKDMQIPILFKKDKNLHQTYLYLRDGEVKCEDGSILEDKSVAEFYYNSNLAEKYRWIPRNPRHDKTRMIRLFKTGWGNYSTVAEKIWRSIENPILLRDLEDLSQGNDVKKDMYFYDKKIQDIRKRVDHKLIVTSAKENTYFQLKSDIAKPMRAFNNWIKSNIIYTHCNAMYRDNKQTSVLDFGSGRGQDIMKFYCATVSFYVGLDIDREGIISQIDGSISRYNQQRKIKPKFPKMLFFQSDVGALLTPELQKKALNVKFLENENEYIKIFSSNPSKRLKFDVINCQFTIHYLFKNDETWGNFKKNINDYLNDNGLILITTFDGRRIAEELQEKEKISESYTDKNGKNHILYEIIKKFGNFNKKDIIGVGNPIDVHLSWFSLPGKYLTEYLVDPLFLIEEMKLINFELLETDSFDNQYEINRNYFKDYYKYEENEKSKKFFYDVSKFYDINNEINKKTLSWNKFFRYYIFRKLPIILNGGGNDNIVELDDKKNFLIPRNKMLKLDENYSFINSLVYILKKDNIIPRSLNINEFLKDLKIKPVKDVSLDKVRIKNILKNIKISHIKKKKKEGGIGEDSDTNGSDISIEENLLNGLNCYIAEKDCNDIYDIDYYDTKSKKNIIMLKENNYYPVLKKNNNIIKGILNNNNPIIKNLNKDV